MCVRAQVWQAAEEFCPRMRDFKENDAKTTLQLVGVFAGYVDIIKSFQDKYEAYCKTKAAKKKETSESTEKASQSTEKAARGAKRRKTAKGKGKQASTETQSPAPKFQLTPFNVILDVQVFSSYAHATKPPSSSPSSSSSSSSSSSATPSSAPQSVSDTASVNLRDEGNEDDLVCSAFLFVGLQMMFRGKCNAEGSLEEDQQQDFQEAITYVTKVALILWERYNVVELCLCLCCRNFSKPWAN